MQTGAPNDELARRAQDRFGSPADRNWPARRPRREVPAFGDGWFLRHGRNETIDLIMLGWLISASRCGSRELRKARGDADAMRSVLIETNGSADVPEQTDGDQRIATWQTELGGLEWLESLVRSGRAVSTSRGGYPETYVIHCRDLMAFIEKGLPHERPVWPSDPGDILGERWLGRTTINRDTLARCDPDEWLLVEAWDES
jgi:hypothetical protein